MTAAVYLIGDDRDFHGAGCQCGLCDRRGISYGVGIFPADEGGDPEVLNRIYGPSEQTALRNATVHATNQGWRIVPRPDDDVEGEAPEIQAHSLPHVG